MLMRFCNLKRAEANLVLAELTPEERRFLWSLRARCMVYQTKTYKNRDKE